MKKIVSVYDLLKIQGQVFKFHCVSKEQNTFNYEYSVEQIRRVYEDNSGIIFVISP